MISWLIVFHRWCLQRPNFYFRKSHLAQDVSLARTSVGGSSPTCAWSASVPLFPFLIKCLPSVALLTRTGCLLVQICGRSLKPTLFTSLMNAGSVFISLKPPSATPLVFSNLNSSLISHRKRLTRTAPSLLHRRGVVWLQAGVGGGGESGGWGNAHSSPNNWSKV